MGEKLSLNWQEKSFMDPWGENHVMTYPLNLQKKSFMEHGGENPVMTCP